MSNNFPKEFKTLTAQCDILINQRKLKIPESENRDKALSSLKTQLIKKNYFDLVNGLENMINFADSQHKYYGEYSITDLLELYRLNKKLRELLLAEISEFEIRLKTSIAYHFSEKHSQWNDYFNVNNYRLDVDIKVPNGRLIHPWEWFVADLDVIKDVVYGFAAKLQMNQGW